MNQKNFNFRLIDFECDVEKAYYPASTKGQSKIGHLLTLSFPQSNVTLQPDLIVCDPEDKQSAVTHVVGIIDCMQWEGKDAGGLELSGNLSFQNRAILQEAFMVVENPLIEASWVIYDFDFNENKYFKHFFTNKPLKFTITTNTSVHISQRQDRTIVDPVNFKFILNLSFHSEEPQEVYVAYRATGTVFTQQVITRNVIHSNQSKTTKEITF